jgi:hypothetical protein
VENEGTKKAWLLLLHVLGKLEIACIVRLRSTKKRLTISGQPCVVILWKFFLVPRIVKSRSQCPNSAVFVENVTILPGTVVTPKEKLEKVDVLINLGLECTQNISYRELFLNKKANSEGF